MQADNHWNPVFGGATYQSLGSGWSIGLHHNWMSQDGFRLGIFLLKNATNYSFNMAAWWQNRKLDPQLGGTSFGISFPKSLSGISSRFSFNLYNEKALAYTSDMEASISFAPRIFNYNIGLFGIGLVREITQRQLFFMSFSNELAILPWSNLSLNISLGLDTRNNMRAMFSINFSPASWISQRYSQDLLNTENRQFSTQTKFAKNNTSINAGYSHRNNNFSGFRVTQNWDNDIVDLRAGVSLKELFHGGSPAQSTSLAFRTGLLFAGDSFAVTSKPAETFAIVDAGQIRNKAPMDVKLNGRSIGGFHKRFGLTGFTNSKQNTIEIDTSSLGYNYENRKEIITPKLGQAFFLPLKNNDAIVATGTLFFPDKHSADLLYGQLFHADSKEDAYWYTGDDGLFSFEGKPGIWSGNVFIDDKRYRLQININESDSIEGALFLGDIVLYEIVHNPPSPLSSLPKE